MSNAHVNVKNHRVHILKEVLERTISAGVRLNGENDRHHVLQFYKHIFKSVIPEVLITIVSWDPDLFITGKWEEQLLQGLNNVEEQRGLGREDDQIQVEDKCLETCQDGLKVQALNQNTDALGIFVRDLCETTFLEFNHLALKNQLHL